MSEPRSITIESRSEQTEKARGDASARIRTRLRLRATKLGKIRFTSHRDVARVWERALRRAELPVASSQGFTPRPRISFGLALPTGAESIAEYIDVDLADELSGDDVAALPATLTPLLPDGFDVLAAAECPPSGESLQEVVTSCTWELWAPTLDVRHHRDACHLLAAASLPLDRERKGKRSADDVRPLILDLRVPSETHGRLIADIATTGRGLRPSELARLAYPHVDPLDVRALRTHQWIDHDGERRELLPCDARVLTRLRELAQPALVDTSTQGVLV
jgi:radical SAM-linked protein